MASRSTTTLSGNSFHWLLLTAAFGFELWDLNHRCHAVDCSSLSTRANWLQLQNWCKTNKKTTKLKTFCAFSVSRCSCVSVFFSFAKCFFSHLNPCVLHALDLFCYFKKNGFFCNIWPFCSHVRRQQLPSQAALVFPPDEAAERRLSSLCSHCWKHKQSRSSQRKARQTVQVLYCN